MLEQKPWSVSENNNSSNKNIPSKQPPATGEGSSASELLLEANTIQ